MTGRDRIVVLVVAAVAALAGAWMLVVQPKRTQAASLNAQVQTLQSQLGAAQGKIGAGLAARSQFAGDYAELARLGEALPQDDEVPSLVYQLQSAANAAGVDFRTLQMAPASGTSSAPSGGAQPLPPGAAMGPSGFPTEQFTFSFTGNFFHLSNFFERLQRFVVAGRNQIAVSGRLLTVNAISFAAAASGFPQITANVSATTYMAPATTGLLGGASAAGPAAHAPAASGTGTPGTAAATIAPPIR